MKYHRRQGTKPGETASRWRTTKREKLRKTDVKRNEKRGKRLEISEKTRHRPKIEDEIVTKTETHKKFRSISTREKNRFRRKD